jgi:hypothetical protein
MVIRAVATWFRRRLRYRIMASSDHFCDRRLLAQPQSSKYTHTAAQPENPPSAFIGKSAAWRAILCGIKSRHHSAVLSLYNDCWVSLILDRFYFTLLSFFSFKTPHALYLFPLWVCVCESAAAAAGRQQAASRRRRNGACSYQWE